MVTAYISLGARQVEEAAGQIKRGGGPRASDFQRGRNLLLPRVRIGTEKLDLCRKRQGRPFHLHGTPLLTNNSPTTFGGAAAPLVTG
jgi:hypothetical protein